MEGSGTPEAICPILSPRSLRGFLRTELECSWGWGAKVIEAFKSPLSLWNRKALDGTSAATVDDAAYICDESTVQETTVVGRKNPTGEYSF